MQALVYNGPGRKNLEDRQKPVLQAPTDAVIQAHTQRRQHESQ
ncbi:hypothetical protein [Polaromonas sp.]